MLLVSSAACLPFLAFGLSHAVMILTIQELTNRLSAPCHQEAGFVFFSDGIS